MNFLEILFNLNLMKTIVCLRKLKIKQTIILKFNNLKKKKWNINKNNQKSLKKRKFIKLYHNL